MATIKIEIEAENIIELIEKIKEVFNSGVTWALAQGEPDEEE